MTQVTYKQFVIRARATELKDNLGWNAEFEIQRHESKEVVVTRFAIKGTYDNKEAAINAAIARGRMVIDKGFSD